jgi:S-adenosylmethionine hydrolase
MRRAIGVITSKHFFIGPDNGLFWPIIKSDENPRIIHLKNKEYFAPKISPTFHGRDIFAPVAAHLSKGLDPLKLGPEIKDPVPLNTLECVNSGDRLLGQVTRIDRFGNVITNIHQKDMSSFLDNAVPEITVNGINLTGLQLTYSDVKSGDPLTLIGSSGYLEISVNSGRASELFDKNMETIIGSEVEVKKSKKP